ncbi:hypothetical protein Bca52824_088526 [Brassica carinata]|uniref:Dihydroorotase, mitochondrial n=1 Tax=Brassica carinata TaxID=52824 RepID=A0A8X7PDW9_BRACI|nr:hypothetical protein Bca52824_088526 [Brassica carinata]
MKQWSLFSILCFVLISFGIASVSAQTCMDNDGHFRPNGTYDTNRRLILSSLPSNVTTQEGLFFNGSIGQEPNRVYAIGMCIPGSTPQDCSDCIKSASDGLIQSCPNQTNAFTWPGDPTLCYVRYSNTSFLGSSDLDPRPLLFNTGDINSNLTEFTKTWEDLVVRMIDAASTAKNTPSSSNNHYKADMAPLTALENIYALMQCTPDLSSGDCDNCLRQSARDYQSCCGQKQGGVVMRPSCFFRWDLYKYSKAFDNITVTSSPPPLPPMASPPPGDDQARRTNNADSDISTTHSSQYDFKTIEAATDKFSRSNKLGEGGFGEVYKGTLSNGTEVAVKRLSKKSGQGIREFKNEAVLVSKLQHRNLVRLLGFCLEGDEKILIYEFVPNKSLNHFVFDPKKQSQLNWTKRYKIIGGIARGILYLHQDSQLTIIHRDLKASNILLDANMNPKISDFGLSTIFGMEQTQGNTSRIAGTYGYMSPEYAMHGQYSMKSDIYSFGVLVLEIISGKKNSRAYQMDETSTPGNLVTYAWRLWRNGSPLELVDPAIGRNYQSNEVTRCIHIALLCVQENPEDRPMLSTIILMLTSNTITLPVPRLPSFIPRSRDELDQISEGLESSQSTGRCVGNSVNDVCMNRKGNFMPNGTYDVNRRLILSSLPSNVTTKEGLFFNGSIGQEPNRVYAVGMCIPGSTSDDCFVCIKLASDRLIKNCSNQTNAFAWPADPTLCHVRYSNTSFLGSADLKPRVLLPKEGDIISNLTEFTKTWEDLVVRMIDAASAAKSTPSSSNNHYRADVAPLTVLQNIYALMQCTPDLSSGDCDTCLRQSARAYQSCCGQKQGGVVTRPSCFFRWDLYAFSKAFDNITVASLPPPRLPPVASPPPAYDHARTTDNSKSDSDISTPHSSQYDFKTVEAATNKFSRHNKLGEGGFGEVYKGTLSNGTEVAVKRLSEKSGQGIREFKNEAVLVSKLQHRNLVKLLGFCLEGEEKILIYEFVPNKSLDYFLFDPEEQDQLHWTQRYKIIGGIARGILYLHQDSQLTVIHRDLKASNILLDANMNPKISDFGLSTIFGMEQTRGNTSRIAGTYGYMSPEYAMQGQYSMKSDIYSFGVLVLEIISGKKNGGVYQMDETSTPGNLVTYAWRLWKNGSPLEMVDLAIGRNYEINEVTRCIHIALLCVQDNPEDRPMLSTIILMLTSNTITLPVPRLPSFIPRSRHELDQVSEGLESNFFFFFFCCSNRLTVKPKWHEPETKAINHDLCPLPPPPPSPASNRSSSGFSFLCGKERGNNILVRMFQFIETRLSSVCLELSIAAHTNTYCAALFASIESGILLSLVMIKSVASPCSGFVSQKLKFDRSCKKVKQRAVRMELTVTQPDDWHLHLRDGDLLQAVVPNSASNFRRAIVKPNLKPPVTTTSVAITNRESIMKALPHGSSFDPLMTLYLIDKTHPDEIKLARESGVVYAVKLYPAGATTNSQDGVRPLWKMLTSTRRDGQTKHASPGKINHTHSRLDFVHGEVTDPKIDVFDRERIFIETVLQPLIQRLPQLKVVMEHITTMDAVNFVQSCQEGFVGATVTPQHLLLNRNALFQGGLQPHNYCLPVLKREIHREAIVKAVTSGSKKFFLGTDSAPHERRRKESSCGCAGIYSAPVALSLYAKVFDEAGSLDKLEAFTSFNGPDFYGLPRNSSKITLKKAPWKVPEAFSFSFGDIIPMFAGETLQWKPFFE